MEKRITTFSEVPLCKNSLYVIDIDDTILHYKVWNRQEKYQKVQYYMQKYFYDTINANNAMNQEYMQLMAKTEPEPIDPVGLENILISDNDVIILTARPANAISMAKTQEDLRYFVPSYDPIKHIVFYNQNKGAMLKQYIGVTQYENIFFIDDQEANIENVKYHVPNSRCFLMSVADYY